MIFEFNGTTENNTVIYRNYNSNFLYFPMRISKNVLNRSDSRRYKLLEVSFPQIDKSEGDSSIFEDFHYTF